MLSTRFGAKGFFFVLPLSLAVGLGCSAGTGNNGAGNGNGNGTGNGNGGAGASGSNNGGAPNLTGLGQGASGPMTGPDGGGPVTCEGGQCCKVVNIASIGTPASYGVNGTDSTSAFTDWLNTASKGTATATMYQTRASFTLTPEFLSKYSVIIFQMLADATAKSGGGYNSETWWTFSPAEVKALGDWVNNGGGIISMSGYVSQPAEVTPQNQILGQFGMMYYGSPDICQTPPTTQWSGCVQSVPINTWNTASPVWGTQTLPTAVGAFHGFPIQIAAGSTAVPFASGDTTGLATPTYVYGASNQVGNGRVVMWFDEWITYTSQWDNTAVTCTGGCVGHCGGDVFRVGQFWFDILYYVAQQQCFKLTDTNIVVH